ncbi:hypothetical protein [Alteromonas sp.]|jgi:hypothetical protein|uniref:hypothetical protein n=1 Tax=Alteromonas sp. TaxID=232 RepID=UPI003195ECA5|tara:strand:+ start:26449 stop:26919 length:471 start_codon:yes stop_codon:yes gene_type:complete
MKRKLKNLVKRLLGKGDLTFHIDTVSSDLVAGWAVNSANPSAPCEVVLKTGDKVLAKTKAATLREDLVAAGIGNGCHGFTLQLDMLPFSAEAREAHVYINGKRVTAQPISLKSSFTDILGEFSVEVERRMDALLAIQNERMQREFDYIKKQLESGK